VEPQEVEDFRALSGFGVRGLVDSTDMIVGSRRLMEDNDINIDGIFESGKNLSEEGKTVVYVAASGKAMGLLALADTPRENAAQAIARLKAKGLKVAMITGDNEQTARRVAEELGVEKVMAEVMPQDKADEITRLQNEGEVVAMIGDGINDAPALTAADIGIAIGAGSDVAIESGDITLIKSDPGLAATAIEVSGQTMRVIKQNLFWAFFYNSLGIPIAAGALYPFFGIFLSPVIAAGAMALSSVSVVTNSLRLKAKLAGY
jgi:Cu+-exporting ATPase